MKTYRFITALVTAPALFVTLVAAHVPDGCRVIDARDPANHDDDVFVCRVDTWFHQADAADPGTRIGNLGAVQEALPTWSTDAPAAAPVNGAGYAAINVLNTLGPQTGTTYDPAGGATFQGSFVGPLDNLAVTLYFVAPGRQASEELLPGYPLVTRLKVDGQVYFQKSITQGSTVRVDQDENSAPRASFAYTDVYASMLAHGADTASDAEHTVELYVAPVRSGEEALFLFDATEVPSGIIFNIERSGLGDYTSLTTS